MAKKELKEEANFEEMEQVEEFGDGWFIAGAAVGVVGGTVVAVIVLT